MLRRLIRRLGWSERGQDLVEFALILPILVLLIMGILDFGRVFHTYLVITSGAREGARYAAVGYSDAAIIDRVHSTSGSTVAVSISHAGAQGDPVTVTVSTDVELVTAVIADFFGANPFPLSSSAQMRYEGPMI